VINLKGNNLRIGWLAILVVMAVTPTLVHAKDYTVGVKAGDWVKYGQITVTWTGNGTEPSSVTDLKKVDWVRIDILSVEGTTANLNFTQHFNNGTQTFQSMTTDVQSGNSGAGLAFLVASNLTFGDPLSPQTPQTVINQTVTGLYAGANRNVNMIDSVSSFQGYTSEYKLYWDQTTGILVELYTNQTGLAGPGSYEELSLKATETNLWSANASDLIQNNLIYIIAGIAAVIVIVAAATTIVLRRRKTPSPEQPPPPPPSAPQSPPSPPSPPS
jgi:hypothetical protein